MGGTPPAALVVLRQLPNLMTLAALCAGLTSIRFAFQEDYRTAVALILVAAVLDGLDGRVARLLGSESAFGAELDSLGDFVNFGVAPAIMLYLWALQDASGIGWVAALVFALCCMLRLARFNIGARAATAKDGRFFVGVPSPAGAMLVMLPLYATFAMPQTTIPWPIVGAHMVLVGLLMVSRVPTFSLKGAAVRPDSATVLAVCAAGAAAALAVSPWVTLIVIDLAYLAGIVWSFRAHRAL